MKRSKVKKVILLVWVIVGVMAISVPSSAAQPTRIKFRKGAVTSTVSGTLNGYKSKRMFLIRVRGGQILKTEQIKSDRSSKYITVYITSPSGEAVGDSDASCNNRREISPTEAGDYRIEVVECQKADPWSGSFRLRVTVR